MACPSENEVQSFARGEGTPEAREPLERHIDGCEVCRRTVALLAAQSRASLGASPALTAGGLAQTSPSGTQPRDSGELEPREQRQHIGRYVVLERVGAGAMGEVYAAWDSKLARRVAVKLLLPGQAHQAEARERFLREARAMARLTHPNVITVHEVGETDDGQVFIAMEFVEGQTLSRWLESKAPTLAQRLDVMRAAGAGLAAAHRAGLVHRDFKPDNVLVAPGVVRVTDFGLARGAHDALLERSLPGSAPSDAELHLTGTGFLLGTPAYMAPEQWSGQADARSDQFAFCAALAEVVTGRRPFADASTLDALKALAAKGITSVPGAPAWVEAVVVRGGAADPARRFESMDALLAALARDPALSRRRTLRAAAVGVGLVALASAGTVGAQQRLSRCANAGDLAPLWDDAAKHAVRAGLTASGRDFARVVADRVLANVDAWTGQWQAAARASCEARARAELTEAQAGQRDACLDRRRRELGALVKLFSRADDALVLRAVQASEHLGELAACADLQAAQSERPLPADPVARERALRIRDQLASVFAESEAGHYRAALTAAEAADAEVLALDYKPLRAETLLRIGQLHLFLSQYDDAAKALGDAALLAEATGQDRLAAKARAVRAETLAQTGGHAEAVELDLALARAHVERAGLPDESVEVVENAVGRVRYHQSRFNDAEEAMRRSLALRQKVDGAEHARVGTSWNALGAVLDARGAPREALDAYAQAERIWEASLGPDHPQVATNLNDQAIALSMLGEYEQAAAKHQRALEIRTRAFGPESREVAQSYSNMAAELPRSKAADALALYEKALAIYTKLGLEDDRAWVLDNIALVDSRQGRKEEAIAKHREALAVRERLRGPEDRDVARSLHNLASLLAEGGHLDEAVPMFERALHIHEKVYGPRSSPVGYGLAALGDAAFAKKDWAKAGEWFERAVALFEKVDPPDPSMLAYSLTLLADVRHHRKQGGAFELAMRALELVEKGREPDPREVGRTRSQAAELLWEERPAERRRAHQLAETALAELKQGGAPQTDIDDLQRWLARH